MDGYFTDKITSNNKVTSQEMLGTYGVHLTTNQAQTEQIIKLSL